MKLDGEWTGSAHRFAFRHRAEQGRLSILHRMAAEAGRRDRDANLAERLLPSHGARSADSDRGLCHREGLKMALLAERNWAASPSPARALWPLCALPFPREPS